METVLDSRTPLHGRRTAGIDDLWRGSPSRHVGAESLVSSGRQEEGRPAGEPSAPLGVVHGGEDDAQNDHNQTDDEQWWPQCKAFLSHAKDPQMRSCGSGWCTVYHARLSPYGVRVSRRAGHGLVK
jgi:hypothetical protein